MPFYDIEQALHALALECCSESVSARIDAFEYPGAEYSKQLILKVCWALWIQSEAGFVGAPRKRLFPCEGSVVEERGLKTR